jgi:uncharacterized membrane protein YeiH
MTVAERADGRVIGEDVMLLTSLDIVGAFVFALSGGALAVEKRLDPFGVVFLAFVACASGGIARDVLIGATPPTALRDWHYFAVACVAGATCYFGYGLMSRLSAPAAFFDSVGLGLFAVVGARKALDAGLSPLMAAMLGMITAIGGGMARDVLTARTPMVFRRDIYAIAALAGAALLTFGDAVGLPDALIAPLGAAFTICIRLIAIDMDWHLPAARLRPSDNEINVR